MISPILTYNSEVWGLFIKSKFKFWDAPLTEKGQYFKRYLQVNNKASNIGRYLLIFDINKRILKYISYSESPLIFIEMVKLVFMPIL